MKKHKELIKKLKSEIITNNREIRDLQVKNSLLETIIFELEIIVDSEEDEKLLEKTDEGE